jgi:hypothetical protein
MCHLIQRTFHQKSRTAPYESSRPLNKLLCYVVRGRQATASFFTHFGPVTQICVICVFCITTVKDKNANLPFNTHLVFTHLITKYINRT